MFEGPAIIHRSSSWWKAAVHALRGAGNALRLTLRTETDEDRLWRHARSEEATEAFYRRLRERYVVSVERLEEGDGDGDPQVAEARP